MRLSTVKPFNLTVLRNKIIVKYFTTLEDFEQNLLSSNTTLFLVFFANWCSPCQKINTILREIDIDYKEKIQIINIDTEQHPEITKKYSIKGFPTFIIIREGKVIGRKVGGDISKIKLTAFIDSNL